MMTYSQLNRVIFLGAAFRATMAQVFLLEIDRHPELSVGFISVESPSTVFPPIGDYMPIVLGPKFDSVEFMKFLSNSISGFEKVLIIPFMDSASRALSKWGRENPDFRGFVGAPDSDILTDKAQLQTGLPKLGLETPQNSGNSQSVIIKPRFGFGSRDMQAMRTSEYNERRHEWGSDWVVQDFISGPEISLDVYVSKENNYSAIARDRIRVSEGEVTETRTRDLDALEMRIVETLIVNFALRGPINVQLIGENKFVLEVNPRFSGGCTASIAAGWNAPEWLISEYLLDQPAALHMQFDHVHVVRSRRDHVRRVD